MRASFLLAVALLALAAGCDSTPPSPEAAPTPEPQAEATPSTPVAQLPVPPAAPVPLTPQEVAERFAVTKGEPITAEELIKAYGVVTGRAAEWLDAADKKRDSPSAEIEKRTWECGEGLGRITVTENVVLGEPYRIEVWGWHRTDKYEKLREENVDHIYYGHEPPGPFPEVGLRVTDPAEIRSVCEALRKGSYEHGWSIARRPWKIGDGPVKHSRGRDGLGVGVSFDPTIGVHIHLKSGEVQYVACIIHGQGCEGPHFRNDLLGQALIQIAERQNMKLPGAF